MKVIVMEDGPYGPLKAKQLKAGQVSPEWPAWYVESLLESGLAQPFQPEGQTEEEGAVESQQEGPDEGKVAQVVSTDETEVVATQSARVLAGNEGIDITKVKGTGSDGKILKADVEAHIASLEG